jgi:hypothetical protein
MKQATPARDHQQFEATDAAFANEITARAASSGSLSEWVAAS